MKYINAAVSFDVLVEVQTLNAVVVVLSLNAICTSCMLSPYKSRLVHEGGVVYDGVTRVKERFTTTNNHHECNKN